MLPPVQRQLQIPSARRANRAARDSQLARQLLREASAELARLRRIRGAYRKTWRRIARARARLAFAAALLVAGPPESSLAGTPRFEGPLLFTGEPSSPAVADIDGDGDLDVLVGGAYGGSLFFRNSGASGELSFEEPIANPFGLEDVGSGASPSLVDIDGDLDLDAFIGETAGSAVFFENLGNADQPAFGEPITAPFGLEDVGFSASPAFVDIDDDGDFDAFLGELEGNTIFFENVGNAQEPAFEDPITNPFGLADVGFKAAPAFADIDTDGDLDAFLGNEDGDTLFFRNTGTADQPAFDAPVTNPMGLVSLESDAQPAFGDIDGDGDPDALIGEGDGFTLVFENTGTASTPAFRAPPIDPFGLADVGPLDVAPAFADIDGDGDLDAFLGTYYGNTFRFVNTGSVAAPAFAGPSTFGVADVGYASSPALADIDGDGDLDVFVGNADGNTIFFANTGSATSAAFAASVTNPFGLQDVGSYASPAFADIDGDGDLDTFVGNADGDTVFFENLGTTSGPAFAAPVTNPFGLTDVGYNASPALVDIDGDGDLDVFVGNADGNTIFFASTGAASALAFADPVTNPFGLIDVGSYASPAFADIDGDGDFDAFLGNYEGGTVFFENLEIAPECSDGVDNDGNGVTDLADVNCTGPDDPWEFTPNLELWECRLGPEMLAAVPLFVALRRRFASAGRAPPRRPPDAPG
jgi:uncharacterized protein (DUF2141 family)